MGIAEGAGVNVAGGEPSSKLVGDGEGAEENCHIVGSGEAVGTAEGKALLEGPGEADGSGVVVGLVEGEFSGGNVGASVAQRGSDGEVEGTLRSDRKEIVGAGDTVGAVVRARQSELSHLPGGTFDGVTQLSVKFTLVTFRKTLPF